MTQLGSPIHGATLLSTVILCLCLDVAQQVPSREKIMVCCGTVCATNLFSAH
ncbi:hypothetical protein PF005_g20771 [Phytophthora fragariae]|uniref:Malic enzyme NAD-binding domain-containing protein n=1 Tax=Phytophthora fragariae TaxID=53985 RepID=A0A6A3QL18_9STRA|nr:hypothetical protein PF003_g20800 [Phytophthora fragariae]KAE8927709.1 hypothetical protein PF009_g22130 [Phytophthora fragariae]KAE9002817.1 hypothetical protein PF011_g13146 [Phytophthora fragariae]KAE9078637.1 hypothetical protein PF007_g23772 [Phytophthora fragariae]KAE9079415.1 hypothetical protein PF010_g22763 [Phytophthora fragariae]